MVRRLRVRSDEKQLVNQITLAPAYISSPPDFSPAPLRVPGFAGSSDHGTAGRAFVGNGAAVGEVLLVLGFVDALLVHHHALG